MSNCMRLYDHFLTFTQEEFDIKGFKKLYEEEMKKPKYTEGCTFNIIQCLIADYVSLLANDEAITFDLTGAGCWRELRNYIGVIDPFILKPKIHKMHYADEGDDYNTLNKMELTLPYGKKAFNF